jgi:hypothetical protein
MRRQLNAQISAMQETVKGVFEKFLSDGVSRAESIIEKSKRTSMGENSASDKNQSPNRYRDYGSGNISLN